MTVTPPSATPTPAKEHAPASPLRIRGGQVDLVGIIHPLGGATSGVSSVTAEIHRNHTGGTRPRRKAVTETSTTKTV